MTYPSQPDFTSVSDTDAWWFVGYGSPTTVAVCSVGGRAFVDLTQMILGVTPDGRWGAGTSAALVNALRAAGASSTLIGGVQAEASAQRVSVSSVRGAIFLMHRGQAFGGGTPIGIDESSIAVQPNAVFPQWNVAAPAGPSGDMPPVCVPRDASAATPGPVPMQPIPTIDVTVPPPDAGVPPSQPTTTIDPVTGKPVIMPAASSRSGLLLGLVAVAAVGGVAWYAMKKPAARSNPRTGDVIESPQWHGYVYGYRLVETISSTPHTAWIFKGHGSMPYLIRFAKTEPQQPGLWEPGVMLARTRSAAVEYVTRSKTTVKKNPSSIDLNSIKTIYRDANLALWGIPYKMRSEVGQQPRDLDRARNTKGWVYLGSPGWWGTISREDQAAIKEWFAGIDVPGSWYEWGYVEDLRK